MTSLAVNSVLSQTLFDGSFERTKNIFRTSHDRNNPYTLITNKLLRDQTIKHSDRGLMCQLLSWSDYHHLCIQAVVKRSVEGRDAIRGMIDRLITAGYIRMVQLKAANGQFDKVVYQIFEESTGHVVADIDLSGIVEDSPVENSPQLDLFNNEECHAVMTKNENVNQTANGKTAVGKSQPNNNYPSINTKFSSSKEPEKSLNQPEDQGTLLRKWYLDISDHLLQTRLHIAGLNTFIVSQEQLNRFLIDFNQQYEKYSHLNHTQRLKNFTSYLVRVKHTPSEYNKHLARLRAIGVHIEMPIKQKREQPYKKQVIERHQVACNPFDVVKQDPVVVNAERLQSMQDEGF